MARTYRRNVARGIRDPIAGQPRRAKVALQREIEEELEDSGLQLERAAETSGQTGARTVEVPAVRDE